MFKINNAKLLITISTLSMAATLSANAADNGLYAGGQLGYGNVHQQTLTESQVNSAVLDRVSGSAVVSSSHSAPTAGLAGRVFAGYQFTQQFAFECGYTKFSNATSSVTGNYTVYEAPVTETIKQTTSTDAIDLVLKAILPLSNHFSFYGKLGEAILNSQSTYDALATGPQNQIKLSGSETTTAVCPTFGIGVAYDITPKVVTDISWNHVQTGDGDNVGNTDLVSAGLSYHFI